MVIKDSEAFIIHSCNISKLPHFKKEQNSRKKVPKKGHFFKIKGPIGDNKGANRNY
jgi:hypothetical protein